MQYFHQITSKYNKLSTHLFVLVLIVLGYIVGQIPLGIALVLKQFDVEKIEDQRYLLDFLGSNLFLFLVLISFLTAFVILLVSVKFILKRKILTIFTLREKLDWKRIFLSFFIWFTVLGILHFILYISTKQYSWNLNPSTFISLLLLSLFLIPIQTTCEELVFRGYFMQIGGQYLKKGYLAIIFSGVLFGLMHGSNPEVEAIGKIALLYYISSGLFLGILTVLDDGIELSMGYHFANNFFACLIVTSNWQVLQTDAIFMSHLPPAMGWDSFLTMFLIQPLLILFFAKIYRWKHWKNKLFSK